jgi:hypothetical protein
LRIRAGEPPRRPGRRAPRTCPHPQRERSLRPHRAPSRHEGAPSHGRISPTLRISTPGKRPVAWLLCRAVKFMANYPGTMIDVFIRLTNRTSDKWGDNA